eukprot:12880712-Alexandrium_andersonii.AAC.1
MNKHPACTLAPMVNKQRATLTAPAPAATRNGVDPREFWASKSAPWFTSSWAISSLKPHTELPEHTWCKGVQDAGGDPAGSRKRPAKGAGATGL